MPNTPDDEQQRNPDTADTNPEEHASHDDILQSAVNHGDIDAESRMKVQMQPLEPGGRDDADIQLDMEANDERIRKEIEEQAERDALDPDPIESVIPQLQPIIVDVPDTPRPGENDATAGSFAPFLKKAAPLVFMGGVLIGGTFLLVNRGDQPPAPVPAVESQTESTSPPATEPPDADPTGDDVPTVVEEEDEATDAEPAATETVKDTLWYYDQGLAGATADLQTITDCSVLNPLWESFSGLVDVDQDDSAAVELALQLDDIAYNLRKDLGC